jgi:sugar lactone lactonase YvrE
LSGLRPIRTIAAGNILGECILWDEASTSVWWTDIEASTLYRYEWGTHEIERYAVPERLCSFGLVENEQRLICAFESGFAFYEPQSRTLEWLYRPEADLRGTRFNDGRVDRQGRFWAGTMIEGEARDGAGQAVEGSLYWLSATARGRALGGIEISNSLAWSPDSGTLYFADSPTRRIRAYDFDGDAGTIGAGRVFAEVAGPGVPDGSTVDAEGFLWNAEWGGSRIVRYAPSGKVDATLDLPVSQPTCLCFGGDGLDLLFVTTATEGLSRESLREQPAAGDVLVYQTGVRGLAESRFRA